MDNQAKIEEIQEEIKKTPYHKGTQRHIGRLRARIAQLKSEMIERQLKLSASGGGGGYAVSKHGDATVVLVGPPSAGKSTLLNQLTDANSKVAEYEFTTLEVIPGMLNINGARIQLLDIPGLIKGAARGLGRGKEVLSVARIADLIILMTDVKRENELPGMESELADAGVRLNQNPPKLMVKKMDRGGIQINSSSLTYLDKDTIKDIARTYRIVNAQITIKEDLTPEQLIDTFSGNRVYVPALKVVNKADEVDLLQNTFLERVSRSRNVVRKDVIRISAQHKTGLDKLTQAIWDNLGLIRLYLKSPQGDVDMEDPLVVSSSITVKQAVTKLSFELEETTTGARIWGKGAKYEGQKVGLNHQLKDGTIIQFI